jgi:hypothetical protein
VSLTCAFSGVRQAPLPLYLRAVYPEFNDQRWTMMIAITRSAPHAISARNSPAMSAIRRRAPRRSSPRTRLANWVIQTIGNLVMDLDNAGCWARFLVRDRDERSPALMDEIQRWAPIKPWIKRPRCVLSQIRRLDRLGRSP